MMGSKPKARPESLLSLHSEDTARKPSPRQEEGFHQTINLRAL